MRSDRAPGGHALVLPVLALQLVACGVRLPTVEEVNEVALRLHQYHAWAWMAGIGAIWADIILPIPQAAVVAALGVIYGTVGGGLVGTVGLVTGGWLGYAIARHYGRRPVTRLIGEPALAKMEKLFERTGMWAIVLTRSLPYSIPEGVVFVAGLSGMPARSLLVALTLGSLPTAFVFSAIGAGWDQQPALALAVGYVLPIGLLPLVLLVMRSRLVSRPR